MRTSKLKLIKLVSDKIKIIKIRFIDEETTTKDNIINRNRITEIIIAGHRLEREEDRYHFIAINAVHQDIKNINVTLATKQ